MAIDPKRPLAFVAIANDDQIAVINTKSLTLKRTLSLRTADGRGTTPTQVTVTEDGCDLLSADSGEDAVAVFALSRATAATVHRASAARSRSSSSAACPLAPTPRWRQRARLTASSPGSQRADSASGRTRMGPTRTRRTTPTTSSTASSTCRRSSGAARASCASRATSRSASLTPQADRQIHPVNQQTGARDTPIRPNGPIKHVFYIVKENRTYDQVLGDDPRGDGDSTSPCSASGSPRTLHALARRFPLLDHVYANSEASIDGHYWTAAGAVSDYVTKNWPQNYSGRGRPYDFGAYEVSAPPKGYIFERADRRGHPVLQLRRGARRAVTVPRQGPDRRPRPPPNAQVLKNSDVGLNALLRRRHRDLQPGRCQQRRRLRLLGACRAPRRRRTRASTASRRASSPSC